MVTPPTFAFVVLRVVMVGFPWTVAVVADSSTEAASVNLSAKALGYAESVLAAPS